MDKKSRPVPQGHQLKLDELKSFSRTKEIIYAREQKGQITKELAVSIADGSFTVRKWNGSTLHTVYNGVDAGIAATEYNKIKVN